VRIQAEGPVAGDVLKCQLKPVTTSNYTVTFTPAELVRLKGVCDCTKPGIGQLLIADTWLRYFDLSGAWARMGHTSLGN
jgi:hypothetical protein